MIQDGINQSVRVLEKEYRVYGATQVVGGILHKDLGIKASDKVLALERRETISLEALPQFDADYIFLEVGTPMIGGDKGAEKKFEDMKQSAIWKSLTAVKNNHVFMIPYWTDLDVPFVNEQTIELITKQIMDTP